MRQIDAALESLCEFFGKIKDPQEAAMGGLDFALAMSFRHPEYARWLYEGVNEVEDAEQRDRMVDSFVRAYPIAEEVSI